VRKLFLVALAFVPVWACAGAGTEDSDGSGGTGNGTGGNGPGSGGFSSTSGGAPNSSGGASSTGGTPSTGGSATTGGATSSGGATTGGATSSGGAASGGAGTGGEPPYEGDCANQLTHDEWDDDMEDNLDNNVPIVYVCPIEQAACAEEMVNEPWLFECVSHHANDCATQLPWGANSWAPIDSCANLGYGGMGGMGGGGP